MKILDPDKQYSVPRPKTEIEALIRDLYQARTNWINTHSAEYIAQYHNIYHQLRELGWEGSLDIEAELPANLMPKHYLDMCQKAQEDYLRSSNTLDLSRSKK